MNRFRDRGLLVLAVLGAFPFCIPFEVSAEPPSHVGTAPVTVMNTPLPVSGNIGISGTPNVSVSNTPNVNITNTQPVPVTLTNNAAQEPTRAAFGLGLGITSGEEYAAADVHLPKQAVPEAVSATCTPFGNPGSATLLIMTSPGSTGVTVDPIAGNVALSPRQSYRYHFDTELPRKVVEAPCGTVITGYIFIQQPGQGILSCGVNFVIRYIE